LLIRNETRGQILADAGEVADSSVKRRRGLLGRDSLRRGEALWIAPCEGIHTFWMKFSIDVVYLDRNKRVLKIRPAIPPWRLSLCLRAHSVLELPAGIIQETGTVRGDQLTMTD